MLESRQYQTDLEQKIKQAYLRVDNVTACMPTGHGKTHVAMKIAEDYNKVFYVTSNNNLVSQLVKSHSAIPIIGAEHYEERELEKNKAKIRSGGLFVFNYHSYLVHKDNLKPPDLLIFDEAHLIPEFLAEQTKEYTTLLAHCNNEYDLLVGLNLRIDKLNQVFQSGTAKLDSMIIKEISKLTRIASMVKDNNYVFNTYQKFVSPLKPSKFNYMHFLKGKKILLLSATITPGQTQEIFSQDYEHYIVNNQFDPAHRVILYEPLNNRRDIHEVSERLSYPKDKTIVICSYANQTKLHRSLQIRHLFNCNDDKDEIIEQFRQTGMMWLAAGIREGIDLPDNCCKEMIIPQIIYANLGDARVSKLKGLRGGEARYHRDAYAGLLQALGRAIRSPTDECVFRIWDPLFPKLYQHAHKFFPGINVQWGK